MDYLTVLDYTTGEVDIYPTELEDEDICSEDLIDSLKHDSSNCCYMYGKK